MKHLVPTFLVLALLSALLLSGCEYHGEGSGFTQRDLELQRRNAERSMSR